MQLTVGKLREIMKGLPDSATISPVWASGCIPGDHEPGVEIADILKYPADEQGPEYLGIVVKLFYLDEQLTCDECGEVMPEDTCEAPGPAHAMSCSAYATSSGD